MALSFGVDANFGTGKASLATVTFTLYAEDYVTVLDSVAAASVVTLGSGGYGATLTAPDDFARGWVQAAANDGSGDVIGWAVNVLDLGLLQTGAGAYTVQFAVTDGNGSPVPGAAVSLRSGGMILAWTTADALGVARIGMPAGSYTYTVTAGPHYTQVVDQALVVDGDEAVAVTLTAQAAEPPVAAGLCAVRFYTTLNGTPQNGYVCRARLIGLNATAPDELLSNVIDSATTGEDGTDGVADLVLVQQGQFTHGTGLYELWVTAPDGTVPFRVRAKIPNTTTANAEDLIPS